MVVLEAAAIGAAGYGVYRGGDAAVRKGQEAVKEHKRERGRQSQRKELAQKSKDRKGRLAQLNVMREGPTSSSAMTPATAIGTTTASLSSSTARALSSDSSSSVLDRMRKEHSTKSSGGRFKSMFKKK